MDIFFTDPNDIPLPPEEVRIRDFRLEPWPDRRRVRVYLELTPFQKRPNGEIEILDAEGNEVSSLAIIETIDPKIDLTVHLRGADPSGGYTASAIIYYYEAEEPASTAEGNLPDTSHARRGRQVPSFCVRLIRDMCRWASSTYGRM